MMVLGNGVYDLSEAARLAGLRRGRVKEWFEGRSGRFSPRPVFESDYELVNGDMAISFLDLIEVCIAGKLREATPPVSLQHIRKVHQKLARDYGESHPFCSREIYHSAGKIFTRQLDDQANNAVIEPLTNQLYLDNIILPFLEKIDYNTVTRLAERWRIADMVVIDPAICFGKPIVEEVGIATSILASAYYANGKDAHRVARWYGVQSVHVEAAAAFEDRLAA
jgi:uncharacterized protein (DUF433 family)